MSSAEFEPGTTDIERP